MRKFSCIAALIATIFLMTGSCSKKAGSSENDCATVPRTFASDDNPIFQTFCNQPACHESGSTNGVGPLTNYTQIFNNRFAIRDAVVAGTMPQNTTLSVAQKKTITCWIDSGAPNN